MTTFLTYNEEFLTANNAYWTAKEISQQPQIWRQASANVEANRAHINQWLEPILAMPNLRIVLTGAGTSAYVGDSIVPHLSKQVGRLFEAISTTDLVSNPTQYLLADTPTLLISYGRSGNSPESVAAIELADQVVKQCYHLVLTCNPEGALAVNAEKNERAYSILMPEGTLDKSFAMTSSFTSMLVSTLAIFTPDLEQLELAANWTEYLLDSGISELKQNCQRDTQRLVFLGSGGLQGTAREAALKCLELTAGKTLSYYESSMGFRHGPKSLMDGTTEVFMLMSSDSYTKRYDVDLLAELERDNQALAVTCLNKTTFASDTDLQDVWASLPYITYCQVLSFFKSINAQLTPDNPCPTGEVNRVVQGVTIYPLEQ